MTYARVLLDVYGAGGVRLRARQSQKRSPLASVGLPGGENLLAFQPLGFYLLMSRELRFGRSFAFNAPAQVPQNQVMVALVGFRLML